MQQTTSLDKHMFDLYNHLSFTTPYYFTGRDDKIIVRNDFAGIVNAFPGKKHLDITAIIEVLCKRHPMGDRTLIKGINKTPWMAKPNEWFTGWEYAQLPEHGEHEVDDNVIAKALFDALCDEIIGYIGNKKNVGVLLSGGMDSRIAAGVIDWLIKNGTLKGVNIVALTWGNTNSRDVVYSKRIADMLGWEWKHYTVGRKEMLYNIEVAAQNGSECSAVHLHALPLIRDENNFDCVIAASYGDSIGRAEYSGIKVENLKSLNENYVNFGGLLKQEVYNGYLNTWTEDVEEYHRRYPRKKNFQQFELDYQLHYMRRLLNPCMEVLGRKMPFYQMFTHPAVFGYMWGLKPEKRTDNIYGIIMKFFNNDLNKVPWARTGIPYGEINGSPDKYEKDHHTYRMIICRDIFKDIKDAALSDEISRTGIFNMHAIKTILKKMESKPRFNFDYVERISWLASFAKMLLLYQVSYKREKNDPVKESLYDKISGNIKTPLEYETKYYFRKLRG